MHRQKIRLLLFIFLVVPFLIIGQSRIEGKVLQSALSEPVPFCAIGIKNSPKGCLSNEEGFFSLMAGQEDTLLVSCIGYKKKTITVREFVLVHEIRLEQSENLLEEVVVYSNDYYLYGLFEKSRNVLKNSVSRSCKAYFILETEIASQAVELIECFYNANLNSNRIHSLDFKNGRIGVAPYKDRYFVSLNSSKVFTFLNLLYPDTRMPSNPYQYSGSKLRKYFKLTLVRTYDSLQPVLVIAFSPLQKISESFSGEIHLYKNSFVPLKISLSIENTRNHPFLPLFPESRIQDVSMQIQKSFELNGDSVYPQHMDFNYQLNFFVKQENRQVKSKGLMYFYDYSNTFFTPLYDYDPDADDYRKISGLSFNEEFWNDNSVLVYTKSMKAKRKYFEENGLLINYKNDGNQNQGLKQGSFFENSDLLWSKQKRLSLKIDGITNDTSDLSGSQQYLSTRYSLKAGIFLDANPMKEGLQHFSCTVFKVHESYYNLKQDAYTNCFINIYFDLCEMERRKMETEIAAKPKSWEHIKACYLKAMKEMDTMSLQYFKEVERGKNKKKLEEWNKIVKLNLGIDNFALHDLQ